MVTSYAGLGKYMMYVVKLMLVAFFSKHGCRTKPSD